ncbi:MAG: hypothetical protein P8X73_13545 [Ignavibacteriaceae bacterium]|jgi:hypothetical protein
MTILIILLVFSVLLNVILILGAFFSRADRDMEFLFMKEALKRQIKN